MTILEVANFSKSYDDNEVIHDISFSIDKGDMFAVLGVNGAGKTTLLECIEGLRIYQKGSVTFLNDATFGVQLQSSTLPENITVSEIVKLICVWNKSEKYDELISLFDLKKIADQRYNTLSTGQKRKLHLVLALVHDSDILFLDEPTAGLDVEARFEFHELLRKLNNQGKTIVFSSHDMYEVETLCNNMIFLQDGKIKYQGSIDEFKNSIVLKYELKVKTENQNEYISHDLKDLTDDLLLIVKEYKEKDIKIVDLQINKPTLEDVFLKIVEGEKKWRRFLCI